MHDKHRFVKAELRCARRKWGTIPAERLAELQNLIRRYHFSVSLGDILKIDDRWYVSHSGLLRLAHRRNCSGIKTSVQSRYCEPNLGRWVFKATVYNSRLNGCFVGYGDADPSNVSSLVHGAELRIAETRAVNRALRKAYGIGLCSVEEMSWAPKSNDSASSNRGKTATNRSDNQQNGQPRLRDRLCLLIRQHQLDAGLVKAYAADYCGTPILRDARRDQVEAFINDLAERAAKDRDGLICQLNSYSKSEEVTS